MTETKKVSPMTFTCKEATKRHRGTKHMTLTRMCERGAYLIYKHGSREKIPVAELRSKPYLFAEKVGRIWQIPVAELDRLFLGERCPKNTRTNQGGCNCVANAVTKERASVGQRRTGNARMD